MNLLEKWMPHVQGLYPNGWATSYVTIFLRGHQMSTMFLLIEGYNGKQMQPLTLELTADGKISERHVLRQEDSH